MSKSKLHEPSRVKLIAVGDPGVGKSALLHVYSSGGANGFPTDLPNVIDASSSNITGLAGPDGPKAMDLIDTGSITENTLPFLFHNVDVVLLAYSLAETDSGASFGSVRTVWIPFLKQHCPNTPFVLVGTKKDIASKMQKKGERDSPALWADRGVVAQFECSALKYEGVNEVFKGCISAAIGGSNKGSNNCTIS